ncbi:MAG: Holliday junction resolvase RuvX [Candidatus Saccharibacteria bacterium]
MAQPNNLLAIDVGASRIGLARASVVARLPEPLVTLKNDGFFVANIKKVIADQQIDTLIVGLPRNMQGRETDQSKYVREFCDNTLKQLNLPIIMQDETLSTVKAEEWLKRSNYKKASLDSVSAVIILEDYLNPV